MDILYSTSLSIPLFQVVLLLSFSTLALLFGRLRLALLINYCFTLYWGYFLNLELFSENGVLNLNSFTVIYFAFGIAIVMFAMVGFMYYRN